MPSTSTPVGVGPQEAEALSTVHDWSRAFAERDLDRLLALADPDVRLGAGEGAACGHDGVRRMLYLQSYGVALHPRPLRYHACGSTVAVHARVELRWVDGGELAGTEEGVALFEIRDGRVQSFCPQPDLPSAFRHAGWPPATTLQTEEQS